MAKMKLCILKELIQLDAVGSSTLHVPDDSACGWYMLPTAGTLLPYLMISVK